MNLSTFVSLFPLVIMKLGAKFVTSPPPPSTVLTVEACVSLCLVHP